MSDAARGHDDGSPFDCWCPSCASRIQSCLDLLQRDLPRVEEQDRWHARLLLTLWTLTQKANPATPESWSHARKALAALPKCAVCDSPAVKAWLGRLGCESHAAEWWDPFAYARTVASIQALIGKAGK